MDPEKVLLNLDVSMVAQRGNEVNGLCPMHKARTGNDDHSPSWWVNLETGVHLCFSCGYKGNMYTLVRDLKGLDHFDIQDFLKEKTELPLDVLMKRLKDLPQYITPDEPIGMSEARLAVFTDVPEIELKKRFLTREAVNAHGVVWDPKNNAWILPIREPNDFSLWGWQEKGATGRFFKNYPPGVKKSKTVFGIHILDEVKPLWVVESPLDAVRLTGLGYNAIATYGAIISEDQGKLMRRSTSIIAAFDNDQAGKKASEQMLGFSRKYGFDLKYFNYAGIDVKDVGDMTEKEIARGLETAKHMIYGKEAYA
jgi:DNA primase